MRRPIKAIVCDFDAATIGCSASAVTIKKLKTTGTANRKELSRSLAGRASVDTAVKHR